MRDGHKEFEKRGAKVALVTMGDPEEAEGFCGRYEVPFVCLSDPEKEAYRAFSLGRGGSREMFGLRSWVRGAQATLKGHTIGAPVGDPWQMPGIFVFDADGAVRHARRAREALDNPSNTTLLAVLDKL